MNNMNYKSQGTVEVVFRMVSDSQCLKRAPREMSREAAMNAVETGSANDAPEPTSGEGAGAN